MSDSETKAPVRSGSDKIAGVLLIIVVTLFLGCSGLITLLELPLRLAIGWAIHGWKNFPTVLPLWKSALLPLACLTVATWLVHRFIRWWLAAKGKPIDWSARHTLAATSLVLLGAAAAIALSGVVHQAVWLADAPWFVNRGRFSERGEAINRIKELHLAVIEFQGEHGRYPESLGELNVPLKSLAQSPEPGRATEPFLYLKPDGNHPADDDVVILVSPLLGSSRSTLVVGFTSGATRMLPASTLPEILETRREPVPKARE